MLETLFIIGFIVGCYTGYMKLKTSHTVIEHKSLLNYMLGK